MCFHYRTVHRRYDGSADDVCHDCHHCTECLLQGGQSPAASSSVDQTPGAGLAGMSRVHEEVWEETTSGKYLSTTPSTNRIRCCLNNPC